MFLKFQPIFMFLLICVSVGACSRAMAEYLPLKAVEGSACAAEERYHIESACDGNLDSYCAMEDSTPNGDNEQMRPARGDAPVTGYIWFDLGKLCDVYGVEIVAPKNNFYCPKNIDVLYKSDDGTEKTALAGYEVPYFCNAQVRTIAVEKFRSRYVGLRFNDAYETGRMNYALIQFAEIRVLGIDAARAAELDLAQVTMDGMTHAEKLANQSFVANRLTIACVRERQITDWMKQDGIEVFSTFEEREAYLQKCQQRRKERLTKLSTYCRDYVFVKHCQLSNQPSFASSAFLSDSIYKDRLGDWRMGSELYHLHLNDDGSTTIRALVVRKDGIIRDPSISYDTKTLVFSMRENETDDYHLYTLDLSNGINAVNESVEPKQITFGKGTADLEPCFLPNGEILFTSTRCDICVPCWSSDVTNTYVCDVKGRYLRRLTFDHAHNVGPQVLNDGSVVYTRWEYNDRDSAPVHKLFMMNADGTTQTEYYGNNSISPWSLIHPAALPGTTKILAIASGHHTDQSGRLVRIDRTRGTQESSGLEYVSPVEPYVAVDVDFMAHDGVQPLFQYPWGVDSQHWLVSMVPEGNSNPRGFYSIPFGIYFMSESGERELLVYDSTISAGQIRPVLVREAPLSRAGQMDHALDEGYFYVQNVYYGPGLEGVEPGTIKKIRVIGLENRAMSAGVGYQQPTAQVHTPVSVGNGSWDVKHVLGTVNVEPDGSAFFRAPARMGLYFQMLDENGHMVQTMRSWAMVQPGETFGCIGCHEDKRDTFRDSRPTTDALKHAPQEILPLYQPGEIETPEFWATLTDSEKNAMAYLNVNAPQRMDVPQGFSYMRDIQPIWDEHCVSCHCDESKTPLNLLGDTSPYAWEETYKKLTLYAWHPGRPYCNDGRDTNTGRAYAHSYLQLTNWGNTVAAGPLPIHPRAHADSKRLFLETPDARNPHPGEGCTYVNWLPMSNSRPPMIPADFWGARHSKLMKYLEPTHYGVQLSAHEKELVATWIDLMVPYCGSYMEANTWDRMTHTYVHFYRDQCRPTYLFQEAKRLRHAEIEVQNLAFWKEHLETGKDFPPDAFPQNVVGGMDAQKAFVDSYMNLPGTVPVYADSKNFALNPQATIFSLTSYPWAESNSHYKYRREFAPTNVQDGNPNTYWKPNRRTDLWLKISFGREVSVGKVILTLHLNAGQQKTWETITLEFSDGSRETVTLKATSQPQEFTFPARKSAWIRLTDLRETFPLSENGIAEVEVLEQ